MYQCSLLQSTAPFDTTGLLASAAVRKSSIIFDPRRSWQHLPQKCMKPRGYRGVCIDIQFERFEKDIEGPWETQRIPEVNKTQNILINKIQQVFPRNVCSTGGTWVGPLSYPVIPLRTNSQTSLNKQTNINEVHHSPSQTCTNLIKPIQTWSNMFICTLNHSDILWPSLTTLELLWPSLTLWPTFT